MIRTSYLLLILLGLFFSCKPDVEPEDFTTQFVGVYQYNTLFSYEIDTTTGLPFFEDYQTVVLNKASVNRVNLAIIHASDPSRNIAIANIPVNESNSIRAVFPDFRIDAEIESRGLLIHFFSEAGEIRRVLANR